ncbi:MAG: hypothetical protein Q8O83_02735 [bacterium]|nr:hypothetical protein [bacterium]
MLKKYIHPEQTSEEVFLGNFGDDGWDDIGWKTKRQGSVAYDKNGAIIKTIDRMFPVFAKRKELEEAGRNPDKIDASWASWRVK